MDHCPKEVVIGALREGLDMFDDLTELEKHEGPYKIRAVTVQWNKEHVLGVQFHYKTFKGHHHDGHNVTKTKPFGELFGKVHEETFHIDDNDDIYEIYGFAGLRINKLGFRTYRGKNHAYGVEEGAPFSYKHRGHTFGAAAGGYGKHLDYLLLRTHHVLPEHKDGLLAALD